jgi:hypothetical protein
VTSTLETGLLLNGSETEKFLLKIWLKDKTLVARDGCRGERSAGCWT